MGPSKNLQKYKKEGFYVFYTGYNRLHIYLQANLGTIYKQFVYAAYALYSN